MTHQSRCLVTELSALLKCKPTQLRVELNHPLQHELALNFLKGTEVRTTHLKENDRTLLAEDLSALPAYRQPAYKDGWCDGMTVRQHFFGRHSIRLLYPFLPCVVVKEGRAAVPAYYPLEVLTLMEPLPQSNDENEIKNSGAAELAKKWSIFDECRVGELVNVCVTFSTDFSLNGQVHFVGWTPEGDRVVLVAQSGVISKKKTPLGDLISFRNTRLVAKHGGDCYFLAYFSLSSHERCK